MKQFLYYLAAMALVTGCKGHPVGSRIPRPNKVAAAGITAAVAGAITLANPDLAGRKPETKPGNGRPRRVKQNVPAGVLDRLDEQAKQPASTKTKTRLKLKPCPASPKKTADKAASPKRLPLVPKARNGTANAVHLRQPLQRPLQQPCEPAPTKKNPKGVASD